MKLVRFVYLICFIPFLVSCGGQGGYKDLKAFLAGLEKAPIDSKKIVLSHLVLPAPVVYQKDESRTPFDEEPQKQDEKKSISEPLQNYQLNLLRFIGTVAKNGQIFAYIMVPDNKVYEVKKGDTIGDHNGKIINITPNKLEVREPTGDEGQPKTERIVTLQLKEESTQWTE